MARRLALPLLLLSTLIALVTPPPAPAATTLVATVGPAAVIGLETSDGQAVRQLDPGDYTIVVRDRSDFHSFHLTGPGVNKKTEISFVGDVTWDVTLSNGKYTFLCDAHPAMMNGSFTVGTPQPSPKPTPKPTTKSGLLRATVGPGATISLTRNGKRVMKLAAGRYTITVRDRSAVHSFHLTGPGVNKKTGISFTGTRQWKVKLKKGLYRYFCDNHAEMRGSFRVN